MVCAARSCCWAGSTPTPAAPARFTTYSQFCLRAAQLLLGQIDIDASGTIDYEEFLAATVNLSQLEKEENMYRAFAHFDTDNSGYITEDELEAALRVRRTVASWV